MDAITIIVALIAAGLLLVPRFFRKADRTGPNHSPAGSCGDCASCGSAAGQCDTTRIQGL